MQLATTLAARISGACSKHSGQAWEEAAECERTAVELRTQQGATIGVADYPDGSAGAVKAGFQWAVVGISGVGPGSPPQPIRACDVPITIKLERKA